MTASITKTLELARRSEPAPLDASDLDRMVAVAIAARRVELEGEPPSLPVSRRGPWIALGVAAAAAVAFAIGAWSSSSPAVPVASAPRAPATPVSPPSEVELPGGDRLSAAAGAQYAVLGTYEARTLDVRAGSVLVDARPRADGESLAVRTPHGAVRVVGTVFSVRVEDERTVVRVYEGRVVVTWGGEALILGAGGTVSVGVDGFGRAPSAPADEAALVEEASRAVDRRAALVEPGPTVVALDPPIDAPPSPREELASPPQELASEPGSATRPPRPAFARLWIADGQPERALAAARLALEQGHHEPTWRMVEGDALRALGRSGEAVVAYERAASTYGPALAARAALAAAELRLDALGDPMGARRTLDRYGASGEPRVAEQIEALRQRIAAAP